MAVLAMPLVGCVELGGIIDQPCGQPWCSLGTPTCERVDDFFWVVRGFDFADLADSCRGNECTVELPLGAVRELRVESAHVSGVDCTGLVAVVDWRTVTPGVVELEPTAPGRARLIAARTGETSLFADLRFTDGQQRRAEPSVSAIRILTVRVSERVSVTRP